MSFTIKRLDGTKKRRVVGESPKFPPTVLIKGTNWIAFPECCLRRFQPTAQSPTLEPGRYRISANGASTVVTIAPPPKDFKRGLYDS